MGEALLRQEDGIEHLGQVFRARIAHQADDALGLGLRAAIAQRRRQQGARGGAAEHAFLAQQLARRRKAFRIRDRIGLRHQSEIAVRRNEVLADALDRPAARLRHLSGLHVGGEHRADRIGENHRGLGRRLPHEPPDPGQRAARADADHDGVHVVLHLAQNFRPGGGGMRLRIGRIGELIDEEGAGRASRDRLGDVLVIIGVALAHVGARRHHLGAERSRMQHLLARHLVGHHQERAIALAPADQSKAEPGIARGRLHDGAAGRQPAVGFGRLDHGARRPILERARRIGAFELEKQAAEPAIDAGHLDQGRFADEVENRCHMNPPDCAVVARPFRPGAPLVQPARYSID